jgi:hypothetical protein
MRAQSMIVPDLINLVTAKDAATRGLFSALKNLQHTSYRLSRWR